MLEDQVLGLGIGRCYVVGAEQYDVNGLGTMRNGDIMLNDQGQHGEQLNDCVQDDVMLKDWGQDDKM